VLTYSMIEILRIFGIRYRLVIQSLSFIGGFDRTLFSRSCKQARRAAPVLRVSRATDVDPRGGVPLDPVLRVCSPEGCFVGHFHVKIMLWLSAVMAGPSRTWGAAGLRRICTLVSAEMLALYDDSGVAAFAVLQAARRHITEPTGEDGAEEVSFPWQSRAVIMQPASAV
jgi:hypothetical protein